MRGSAKLATKNFGKENLYKARALTTLIAPSILTALTTVIALTDQSTLTALMRAPKSIKISSNISQKISISSPTVSSEISKFLQK